MLQIPGASAKQERGDDHWVFHVPDENDQTPLDAGAVGTSGWLELRPKTAWGEMF